MGNGRGGSEHLIDVLSFRNTKNSLKEMVSPPSRDCLILPLAGEATANPHRSGLPHPLHRVTEIIDTTVSGIHSGFSGLPRAAAATFTVRSPQTLSLLPVVALSFYGVSGGPFGSEDAVSAAGPVIAVAGFIILPLMWSVPEALITAEMTTAYPEDSGYVAWVTAAFGRLAGFQVGLLSWVSGVVDNALYPVLSVDYFMYVFPSLRAGVYRQVLVYFIAVSLAYVNYRGLQLVGRTAVFLTVFCMLPFVIFAALGIPQVQPRLWEFDNVRVALASLDWRKYLNTIFWNVNYWDSISTLAGEVQDPAHTMPRALCMAITLMMLAYITPLAIGTGICIPVDAAGRCSPSSHWRDGYFSRVAAEVGGRPLQLWLLLAAAFSCIGMFEAEICSDAYLLYGMSERGFIPAFFAYRSRFGTPTVGILCSLLGILVIVFWSFESIIEVLNCLYCVAALIEFAAFLYLRWRRPHLERPFIIPLPLWGLCAMLVFPVVTIVAVLGVSDGKTVLFAVYVVLVGFILYPLMDVAKRKNWCEFHEESKF